MAFVTNDDDDDPTILSEDSTMPKSFITMHVTDPFATAMEGCNEEYPNAKRNLLDDINNAECTVLPPPPQKENLAVFLRVKPKTKKEEEIASSFKVGTSETVKIVSDYQISLTAPVESQTFKNSVKGDKGGKLVQSYSFTKILKPEMNQKELFGSLVCPMVKDFMEGQNQLLFTYGATSAGKTFTMQGELDNSGIIPRSLDTVFNTIGPQVSATVPVQPVGFNRVISVSNSEMDTMRKDKEAVFKLGMDLNKKSGRVSPDLSTMSGCSAASTGSSVSSSSLGTGNGLDLANIVSLFPNLATRDKDVTKLNINDSKITYSVWVSFCEIYQDCCYDLLKKVPDSKKKGERTTLRLCEERDGLPYVKGLREVQVSSADEAYQILMIGRDNLHFAATKLNQQSSRSHCIFNIKIVRVAEPSKPHLARVSLFSFCDLAGSERISKTNNVGDRQKETGNINTSLLILGRCIKAMRHNQNCKDKKGLEVVPFRESKLTRLFKSYFTGQGKSSLIICISQAEYLFDETVHVCKFAHLASKVTIELFKDPPPKKIAKKSNSRFSSMMDREKSKLLSLAANASVLGRSSIAWEVQPGKKSSLFPGTFKPNARSTMAPGSFQPPRLSSLLNISEIEDPGEEDETVLDNTVVQTQYEGLLKLVEDLKAKLIDERKKNSDLEKNIREELCNEFNNMLVAVEQGYEDRLQAEREEAERVNEWRIGELNKVHSKRNKRKRENEEGDCFDEDEMEAARTQSKLTDKTKELEMMTKELEDCQEELKVMKDTVKMSKMEQDKLQGANTKIQFELAEQQRLAAELGRELSSVTGKLEDERKTNRAIQNGESDALIEAERMLSEVRGELSKTEAEIDDLKDLLQEAGNEFMAKEEELQVLQKELLERDGQVNEQGLAFQDLQGQLEESHLLLQEVNNQLEDKEQRIEELEQEMENMETAKTNKLEKKVVELQEELNLAKMKFSTSDEFSLELKESLEKAEKTAEDERLHAKEAEEKMLEAQQERNQLLSVKSKLLQEIAELKTNKDHCNESIVNEKESIELKAKVENLTGLNKVLSESNESLKKTKEELDKEIQSLKIKIDELKSATSVDESLFEDEDDMKERIESLLTEKSSLKDSLTSVKSEMEKMKLERTRLLSQLEKQEVKDFAEMEDLIEKNARLEEELSKLKSKQENEFKQFNSEVEENLSKIKETENNLNEVQKLLKEKDVLVEKLRKDLVMLEESTDDKIKDSEANFDNEKKEIESKFDKEISKKDEIIAKLEKDINENKSQKYSQDQESSMKVSDLESRNGSLEKEVATKDTYIKELEDIIVEKEFKISEHEKLLDKNAEKIAVVEKVKKDLQDQLAQETEEVKKLNLNLKELEGKISEDAKVIAHQEKMKEQRESLEKRIQDCEKTSESLAKVEDELVAAKDEKKASEEKLSKSEDLVAKLKTELEESKGEIKALKKATKNSAKEALEASEIKVQNDELNKELDRLKTIVEANKREQDALDVLKTQITTKSSDVSQLGEQLQLLRTQLGGKDTQLSQLEANMERLKADKEAMEYDLNKTREEKMNLMEHYEKIFRQKQAELDSFKALDKEKGSLGEIMAKATPSKSLGQTKDKLAKAEDELNNVKEKLAKEEDKVNDLKVELKNLQKEFDAKVAKHEREMQRTKLANEKVIAEFRETNKHLQKQVETRVTISPPSPTSCPPGDSSSMTGVEADDSKTDNSLIEGTPVVKRKTGGRGRGRGSRTTRSMASLASFEDSNTENEPDGGRPRVASVSRKARVTRKSSKSVSVLADMDTEAANRSVSRKRAATNKTEASILKETQISALSPVPEAGVSHNSSRDISNVGVTPVQKKKRKLYKQTPQLSEVFTPPTDRENDTPGEIVKKQLRSRRTARR